VPPMLRTAWSCPHRCRNSAASGDPGSRRASSRRLLVGRMMIKVVGHKRAEQQSAHEFRNILAGRQQAEGNSDND
jgi:hypothetical protein